MPESNQTSTKTPDYLWNDKLWELKSTTTAKAANSALRKGLKQIVNNPGGIILNYSNNDVKIDEVVEVIEKRMRLGRQLSLDIIILHNNKVEKILRY